MVLLSVMATTALTDENGIFRSQMCIYLSSLRKTYKQYTSYYNGTIILNRYAKVYANILTCMLDI